MKNYVKISISVSFETLTLAAVCITTRVVRSKMRKNWDIRIRSEYESPVESIFSRVDRTFKFFKAYGPGMLQKNKPAQQSPTGGRNDEVVTVTVFCHSQRPTVDCVAVECTALPSWTYRSNFSYRAVKKL